MKVLKNQVNLTVTWSHSMDGLMMRSNVVANHQIEIYGDTVSICRWDGAIVGIYKHNGNRTEKRSFACRKLADVLSQPYL